ncbi:hypothetical protein BJ684DRAFT_21887 [Piptocephalis cylindrospora]|uniref:RRM domain-containing protein n=1 Tax=Piptocephalis cylindrospora TaxID=1907219 RepID=A0A4P9XYM8_9FUNG|nr:hypothetical protein BJ684DRAFT_21887 [Piptocephalis cylindrospora]|eukprot:RKP11536.1 hypothetical protein BJ684DRAFT_21887 [Piptocephalis cylindrospora]
MSNQKQSKTLHVRSHASENRDAPTTRISSSTGPGATTSSSHPVSTAMDTASRSGRGSSSFPTQFGSVGPVDTSSCPIQGAGPGPGIAPPLAMPYQAPISSVAPSSAHPCPSTIPSTIPSAASPSPPPLVISAAAYPPLTSSATPTSHSPTHASASSSPLTPPPHKVEVSEEDEGYSTDEGLGDEEEEGDETEILTESESTSSSTIKEEEEESNTHLTLDSLPSEKGDLHPEEHSDAPQLRASPQACLFVASLSAAKTEDQLQESVTSHFRRWGHLLNVKVFKDWQQRPYSFVQFARVEDARRALVEAQGTVVDERHVRIEPARVNRSLIIGRYAMDPTLVTRSSIEVLVARFGTLESIRPQPNPATGVPEGSVCVKFAYREDAIRAYLHLRGDPEWHVDWASQYGPSSSASPSSSVSLPTQDLPGAARRIDRCSLFVGQLNPQLITQVDLTSRFARYGEMLECTLVNRSQATSFPRCAFAFVRYMREDAASRAISGEDGARWLDRNIRVQYREPRDLPSFPGYGQPTPPSRFISPGAPGDIGPPSIIPYVLHPSGPVATMDSNHSTAPPSPPVVTNTSVPPSGEECSTILPHLGYYPASTCGYYTFLPGQYPPGNPQALAMAPGMMGRSTLSHPHPSMSPSMGSHAQSPPPSSPSPSPTSSSLYLYGPLAYGQENGQKYKVMIPKGSSTTSEKMVKDSTRSADQETEAGTRGGREGKEKEPIMSTPPTTPRVPKVVVHRSKEPRSPGQEDHRTSSKDHARLAKDGKA